MVTRNATLYREQSTPKQSTYFSSYIWEIACGICLLAFAWLHLILGFPMPSVQPQMTEVHSHFKQEYYSIVYMPHFLYTFPCCRAPWLIPYHDYFKRGCNEHVSWGVSLIFWFHLFGYMPSDGVLVLILTCTHTAIILQTNGCWIISVFLLLLSQETGKDETMMSSSKGQRDFSSLLTKHGSGDPCALHLSTPGHHAMLCTDSDQQVLPNLQFSH